MWRTHARLADDIAVEDVDGLWEEVDRLIT
jgi:hypothetical protein